MLASCSKGLNSVEEVALGFLVAVDYGLLRILGELRVLYNELMKVVSKEISTSVATMAVEDTKERALGPEFYVLFSRRLHDIEYDTDSVFIVVTDDSLVGVRSISNNTSVFSDTTFCWLPRRKIQRKRIRRWSVTKQESLDVNFFASHWLCSLLCTI